MTEAKGGDLFIVDNSISGWTGLEYLKQWTVPEEIWNFHIGCYEVCEKWLKDRGPQRGNPVRTLTDDVAYCHKIVIALTETIRIMAEIDEVIEAHDDWPCTFVTSEGASESTESSTDDYDLTGEALEPDLFDKVADSDTSK